MSSTREQLATNLFLLEELEDVSRTRKLSKNDLDALRTVADWTKAGQIQPVEAFDSTSSVNNSEGFFQL